MAKAVVVRQGRVASETNRQSRVDRAIPSATTGEAAPALALTLTPRDLRCGNRQLEVLLFCASILFGGANTPRIRLVKTAIADDRRLMSAITSAVRAGSRSRTAVPETFRRSTAGRGWSTPPRGPVVAVDGRTDARLARGFGWMAHAHVALANYSTNILSKVLTSAIHSTYVLSKG